MTLERILKAAVNSMIHGHHAPHSFHAHVVGKGYVNDGSPVFDRADYLKQLERYATSEIENLNYATGYAEPGYTDPAKGIVFADWNKLPSGLDDILERAGYAIEWNDEWSVCDCGKAVRTSADSYSWRASYAILNDCELVCRECLDEEAYVNDELLNNPKKADTFDINLAKLGFTKHNDHHYENGFHPGQNDRPEELVKHLPADVDYVFQIPTVGQFDVSFDLWTRPKEQEPE